MAKEKNSEQDSSQEEEKKGIKKFLSLKMLIVVLGIIVLGAGAFFGYKYFLDEDQNATNASIKDKSASKQEPTSMVTLPTILVNLSDPLGKRYLKMTAKLEVQGNTSENMVQEKMPQIKDSIIMLLSSKSYQDLSSMEKKIQLKKQIVKRINQILEKSVVNTVFFTEFVVQ